MVYATGGLGDTSFDDVVHTGIQEAESELNVAFQNAEPGSKSEIGTLQRKFARSSNPDYDLVFVVGFVGGMEIPLVEKIEAGYKTGEKHANGDVEVKAAYAGTWSDPAKRKEIDSSRERIVNGDIEVPPKPKNV